MARKRTFSIFIIFVDPTVQTAGANAKSFRCVKDRFILSALISVSSLLYHLQAHSLKKLGFCPFIIAIQTEAGLTYDL